LNTFSEIVSAEGKDERQRAFIDSLIAALQEYGFDGVDLDWFVLVVPRHLRSN
jgi:GH18 family chitinase